MAGPNPKTCEECGQVPTAVHDYDGDPRRCSWCGTIVPGRELPPTVEEWLASGCDVPEVGRGAGRVLSGTTGELAACVGHLATCDTCRLPVAADGIVSMSMGEDGHVRFSVSGREVRQGWIGADFIDICEYEHGDIVRLNREDALRIHVELRSALLARGWVNLD